MTGTVPMLLANVTALASAAVAYFFFSTHFSAADFGLYAAAVAISRIGSALIDGGLRVVIIRRASPLSPEEQRSAFRVLLAASFSCALAIALAAYAAKMLGVLDGRDATFFTGYSAAYLLTQPFVLIPLATLERNLRFAVVAKAEAVAIVLELLVPIAAWVLWFPSLWWFLFAAAVSRMVRAGWLILSHGDRSWASARSPSAGLGSGMQLFREGVGFQMGSAAALGRDNLHVILVGPIFGKDWVGQYAWALQMCSVASQVFVQTAARISLPAFSRKVEYRAKWIELRKQLTLLAIIALPPIVSICVLGFSLNKQLFDGKWAIGVALLPWIAARMIPGVATTPLGMFVVAEKGTASFARASVYWALAEGAMAFSLLLILGPIGLAVSLSFMAWFGLALLINELQAWGKSAVIVRCILVRASLGVSIVLNSALFAIAWYSPNSVGIASVLAGSTLIVIAAIASEVRRLQSLLGLQGS